ncbi:MAG: diguanylate cyclase [Sulfuritalea sp.]|jgi:diguanylate cyclase (GGDEF)-like protein/PAS domain S-box-containing protein|nr:diguanylate cyclase [Sulfuritalea sp.]
MPELNHLKQSSLTTQWLILGFALLILGGATGFNLYVDRGRTERREQGRLLTQARVIQENLEQNLTAVSRVLADLRKELPSHKANPGLSDRLKMLTDAMPGIRTLLLLDRDGTVLASSRSELLGGNFAYRDYFKTPRQNPDPEMLFVSAPFKTTLGIYGINVARTIPGGRGEFAGLIVATLDPEYFKPLMASVLYAPDMWTAVAHGDGIQFLMVPERDGQAGKNLAQPGSFFSRHRDSGKETNILTGAVYATGEERMMALRSIQPARLKQDKPLVVAVGRDLNTVYAAWRHDIRIQGGLFGLIVLGSTLGLYAYQRRQREFARREAEVAEALAASHRFMETLTDNIPGMVAYWTRELRCGFANKAYLEWFGRTPEQMRGIRIQDMMGDELFRKNEPFISAALRGERQRFERTLTKADGSTAYTWAHYIPDLDGNEVRGFFVLVSDITEVKRVQLALAESEWKLKTIIETEPECVKVLAADGTLLQMNRAGLDLIEAESDSQVIGHKVTEIVAPQYREAFIDLNERVNRGESGTLEFEIVGLKGGHRWLDTHAVPMRDVDGQITGLLGVTRDITARKKAEQALEQLAQTDFLTNLVNRRHFMTLAEQELSRTLRYGGALSVLMMDIDHFKKINDTYGHKTGDVVLRRFAELSRQSLRDIDVIGRVGGEEFAVVLPQTDGEHALEVADRLRKSTGDAEVVLDQGLPLHFTVSIGVATLGGTSSNIDTLLSQADKALYKAKRSGRNRVCAYEPRDGASAKWHEA